MPLDALTFEMVDDLLAAHSLGRLREGIEFQQLQVKSIGPLIELLRSPSRRFFTSSSSWLTPDSEQELRTAERIGTKLWLCQSRRSGLMRTVFDPLSSEDDTKRTQFFLAARAAALSAGMPKGGALCLAAALRELESNILEHAVTSASGLLVFKATSDEFELVAVDNGVGVLATLRQAPDFIRLTDHGEALRLTLQEGISRYGYDPRHGNGFRDLFRGLTGLNAELRFRSGDHALIISGQNPDLKSARLEQKSHFQGFLASVRCQAR